MRLVTNNIFSHSIECYLMMMMMFINIRLLILRSADWKSSLKVCQLGKWDWPEQRLHKQYFCTTPHVNEHK